MNVKCRVRYWSVGDHGERSCLSSRKWGAENAGSGPRSPLRTRGDDQLRPPLHQPQWRPSLWLPDPAALDTGILRSTNWNEELLKGCKDISCHGIDSGLHAEPAPAGWAPCRRLFLARAVHADPQLLCESCSKTLWKTSSEPSVCWPLSRMFLSTLWFFSSESLLVNNFWKSVLNCWVAEH